MYVDLDTLQRRESQSQTLLFIFISHGNMPLQ